MHEMENGRKTIENRRETVVRAALGRVEGKLSQAVIEELKKDLGVSRATAYRMIRTFRSCGAVVAPNTRPVGRPKGARVLDPRRETLIAEAIEQYHATRPTPKFSELMQTVGQRCRDERLPPPNWRTVRSRLTDSIARREKRQDQAF
ncbi:MAG TPA: transposase [Methylocystis sp.]|nr:transposase [Methylocystis sp.]